MDNQGMILKTLEKCEEYWTVPFDPQYTAFMLLKFMCAWMTQQRTQASAHHVFLY